MNELLTAFLMTIELWIFLAVLGVSLLVEQGVNWLTTPR